MSEAAQLQPTLASGKVTATKPSTGGINLLQTDAVVSQGCSGGAALNAAGEVVGIVVSGVSGGQNYLQPVGLLSEALSRSGADLKPSLTSELWADALSDYHQDHLSNALNKFEDVQALYAPHAYVAKYIADSQAGITQGRDKTPPPEPEIWPFVIAAALGVLLLGGAAGVLVVVRRRRGHGPANTMAGDQPDLTPEEATDLVQSGPSPTELAAAGWIDGSASDQRSALRTDEVPIGVSDAAPEQEVDGDAPDAFPSWRPIDFVTAYPPPEPESGKAG